MRIFPILSAILVTAFLFGIIMERDALMALARGEGIDRALAIAKGDDMSPAPGAAGDDKSNDTASNNTASATPDGGPDATPPKTVQSAAADAETDATTVSKTSEPAKAKLVRVVTIQSTARVIDSAVILRGQTEAARSVKLSAETSGRVVSDPIRKGASVQKDQLICALDPGTRSDNLGEAQARLAEARAAVPTSKARVTEAKARLAEAEINQNAAAKLAKGGFASDTRVASADAAVEAAKAGIAQAEGGLATAQAAIQSAEAAVAAATREIERTEIHAPFDGLLEQDTAELGSLLQSGGLCATIIQLDPIKIVGFVPETEVNRIAIGAMAGARLAAGGQDIVGKVSFLSRSADPQTRTFRVEIEVPNPDMNIRDGQTAEIGIAAEGADAHLVPQSALTLNDAGTLGVRTVDADNITRFFAVKLLRDTVDGVWISGLPEEAQVIVIGQEFVIDGVPVIPSLQEPTQ